MGPAASVGLVGGDRAPAWGRIGTILGTVTMSADRSDPAKPGPAMATARLAPLYGALIANLVRLPIADKLQVKLEAADVARPRIIDGILTIRDPRSPTRSAKCASPTCPATGAKGLP